MGDAKGLLLGGDYRDRLRFVFDLVRDMSLQTDPQEMVKSYGARMREVLPTDRRISLSRRNLEPPAVRVTRYSGWEDDVNPWQEPHRLPVLQGGLLAELIYEDQPRILGELDVPPDDPAYEFLEGQRSLMAIPLLDQGKALNMVVLTRTEPNAFDEEEFPQVVWLSNLFGRATQNLVLAEEVRHAYEAVDRELKVVSDMQRSLLPDRMPEVPGVTFAAEYQTSRRAGGDYYDFFPLAGGKWGLLIADVSGHGTPAAVMMAVLHSIAHMFPARDEPPSKLLEFVNHHLCERYVGHMGTFVTAFYGVFDPETRKLHYSSAGHNPPRLKHCGTGSISSLDGAQRLPLGVAADIDYADAVITLVPGDQVLLYTDGITEASSPEGELFTTKRLDQVLHRCRNDAREIIDAVLQAVDDFTNGLPADDDRTLLVTKVL